MKRNSGVFGKTKWLKMSVPEGIVEAWWAGLPAARKVLFHDMIRAVDALKEDDVLAFGNNGPCFLAALMSLPEVTVHPSPGEGAINQKVEDWWAGLSPAGRGFVKEVDRVSMKLTENKILEFRNKGGKIMVTLVTMRPVLPGLGGGKVELN